MEDSRNSFPMGNDSRTPRASFCDTCRSWRYPDRVTAIPFAIFLWRGYSWSKYAVVVWSVLGIADLANALTLGRITSPDFGTSRLATFPWILVPTVFVPAALALHAITLYRLRNCAPVQAHSKKQEA
jgi:hypothetical protein